MTVSHNYDRKEIGARVRASRQAIGASLERLADQLTERGAPRLSAATLSRIESGLQSVSPDILAELSEITGIPTRDLRPDLAAKFPCNGGNSG